MKLNIASVGFVITLVAFVLVYSLVSQQAVPEWMLQYTFYAFMTAIFGFIFLGILAPLFKQYLEERKTRREDEIATLELLRGEYGRCAWSINSNLDKCVKKNEKTDFVARLEARNDFGEDLELSEELKEQIKGYNEKCNDYNIFLKMSERAIRELTEKRIEQMFPKTLKRYTELPTVLNADLFMERYLNGEKVTANWLRDTHPVVLKNITKEIDETEKHELDIYFNEINNLLKKDEVLQRFIKAKEGLIEYGQNTIKSLQEEAKALGKQLQKNRHLRPLPSYEEEE